MGGKIISCFIGLLGKASALPPQLGQDPETQSLGHSAALGRGQVSPDCAKEVSVQDRFPGSGHFLPLRVPSSQPEVPPPFPWVPSLRAEHSLQCLTN